MHLENNGYRVLALQGNMTQSRRQAAIDGFRGGKYDILVATDIAARGIDVFGISHVINYDMPDTAEAYTHRIGRTGRAQETGEAFTLTVPADEGVVHQIEKTLGSRIERRWLAGFGEGDPGQVNRRVNRQPGLQSDQNRRRFRPSMASRKRRTRAAALSSGTRGVHYGN
jgi:ATP-dependent RNA helicase RhlE